MSDQQPDQSKNKQQPCRHTCGCKPDPTKPRSLSRYSSSPSSSSLRYFATHHGNRRTHEKKGSVHPNCTTACQLYKDVASLAAPSSSSDSPHYSIVPLFALSTLEHHTPLPFIPFVEEALACPSNNQILHLQVLPDQDPLLMSEAHRPRWMSTVFTTKETEYNMSVTEFGLTAPKPEAGKLITFKALYQACSSTPIIPEDSFLDQFHNSHPRSVSYLRDMEHVSLWSEYEDREREEGAGEEEKEEEEEEEEEAHHKRRKTEYSSGKEQKKRKGSAQRKNQPKIRHFLNTTLFSNHPRNLLSLTNEKSFLGFSIASTYCKTADSFFCLHTEQLFAPFYNYCYSGSTTWWCVVESDRHLFETYLKQRAKKFYHLDEALSEEEEALLVTLLYTKRVFLDPRDLVRAHVPVYRIDQTENQVVIGAGVVIHWGRCASRYSINEAVNFIPSSWLHSGLPRVLEYLQLLSKYIDWLHQGGGGGNLKLRRLLSSATVQCRLQHPVPWGWSRAFFSKLVSDMEKQRCVDYTPLTESDLEQCVDICKKILQILNDKKVEAFCAEKEEQ